MSRYIISLLFVFCSVASAAPQLYITAGQSNMAGLGGKAEVKHLTANPRVNIMTFSQWDKNSKMWKPTIGNIPEDLGKSGVGPWWSFAQVMAETKPKEEIRILCLAVSGSPLKEWIKGGTHFESSIPRIKDAIKEGAELKGIIWHQGEAGTGLAHGESPDYSTMFEQMLGDIRTALDRPDLPFVAGVLGDGKGQVNDALNKHQGKLAAYAYAVTPNLTLSDNVHYDAPSCENLGIVMAEKMCALEKIQPVKSLPATLTGKPMPAWTLPRGSLEILASGDGTALSKNTKVNLANAPRLYVLGGPAASTTYLHFKGLPATAKKMSLVMLARAIPDAKATFTITRCESDVDESTLTAETAPATSGQTAGSTVSTPDGYITLDISSLLDPKNPDLTLAINTDVTKNPIVLDSREGTFAPRLVLSK